MARYTVIIPAAGQGTRMESERSKQFLRLLRKPVIAHTLRVFQSAAMISEIIVVCAPGEEGFYNKRFLSRHGITKPVIVVCGGRERQDSVRNGLASIPPDTDFVMIHDGARPLVTELLIERLAEEVISCQAVVPGVPVKDTIKRTDSDFIVSQTVNRRNLWSIQTPQAFEVSLIKNAHQQALENNYIGTDDASLVESLNVPVKVITGSYENIKITTPDDLTIAAAILKGRKPV